MHNDQSLPTLSIVASIDPVLQSSAAFDVVEADPNSLAVLFNIRDEDDGHHLEMTIINADGVLQSGEENLTGQCISCATTAHAIDLAKIQLPEHSQVALFPPLGFDPQPLAVAASIAIREAQIRAQLSAVTSVVNAQTAVGDLLDPVSASERQIRGLGDEISYGEALLTQITYADAIICHGETGPGSELVEHLRAHEVLLTDNLHAEGVDLIRSGQHDPQRTLERIDPTQVQPWGGGSEYGTWTLDLNTRRPFHPERLLDNLELIGSGRLIHRGHFWVPTRPHTQCTWEGAGGNVSVGSTTVDPLRSPSTRLIITGQGDERGRLERAFKDCLLTDSEWRQNNTYWHDCARRQSGDGLEPWLGELEFTV